MSRSTVVLLLALAAVLEAGGDALIRLGLRRAGFAAIALMAGGAALLFLYGYFVNAGPWEFGRLLGIYVTLFFFTAQVLSWVVFKQPPGRPVLVGGALVMAGGAVMAIWK
jgi:small multidrug resistance family-3 protein